MLYPIDAYDQHGQLKINKMLWFVLLFNAKAWLVFVMAGVSRTQGGELLELIYPIRETLYLGMAIGSPAILLMWLSGQRNKNNKLINFLWRQGKSTLLAAYSIDILMQIHHLVISHGAFSWIRAITLLLTAWLGLYLLRSSRVRDLFAD
ncbi:DUF2919 domain-containing protein [Photobacterium lucens]|uniref:DUF2919 domain-containing protein n=1 Tax=Photobacterium lucens TaxID=2562949 RepID=UPI0006B53F5F|nr:DUF2919 domain-containing protein [Photobacterium lucens]KPA52659.1 membrane protein [Photobacterium leiognathi subsp. mandapamensis]MBP2699114.1 DUF2919 domain-containing protein [Vibrio parahaemolyticus]MZG56643.1 DUF2919 domain-containing protein [Photobacterium lucens]MZG80563.1 DUF2919 domain-containing protein [Photobacterium lucens]